MSDVHRNHFIKEDCFKKTYDYFVKIGVEKYLEELSLDPDKMSNLVTQSEFASNPSIVIDRILTPRDDAFLYLLKEKFGIDLPEEPTQKFTRSYEDVEIVLPYPFHKSGKTVVRALVHEFWHLIELYALGKFDALSEGTAKYIELNYPHKETFIGKLKYNFNVNPTLLLKELKHKLNAYFPDVENHNLDLFDFILYYYGKKIISNYAKKPTELLKNKKLRKELRQKLLSKFGEIFDKDMIADALASYFVGDVIKFAISTSSMGFKIDIEKNLEFYFITVLSLKGLDELSNSFSRTGVPSEILDRLQDHIKNSDLLYILALFNPASSSSHSSNS